VTILLLAGPIGVGKSSVARQLASKHLGQIVSARALLVGMAGADEDRFSLQSAGQRLDRRTNGRWLLEALGPHAEDRERLTVVDAVRTLRQTEPVLREVTDARLVYLDADQGTRLDRFALAARHDAVKRGTDFARSNAHETERNIRRLKPLAHLVIDTDSLTCDETVGAIVEFLGLKA
jgi:adenylosuccinate synthase